MIKLPAKVPEKGFYYHYKHDPAGLVENYAYEFLGIGFHSEEDGVCFVNYRPLYESAGVYKATLTLGVVCTDERPLEMWMGDVEKDGKIFKRFQKVTDPEIIAKLEKVRGEMYK
jgi:hypothetical protein